VDLVLGGGLARGSVVLCAGAPGVGKSTLWQQIAVGMGRRWPTLYATVERGREDAQVELSRLGLCDPASACRVLAGATLDVQAAAATRYAVALWVVDSLPRSLLPGARGRVGGELHTRAALAYLIAWARRTGGAVVALCHLSRADTVGGHRALEHDADAVLRLDLDGGDVVLGCESKNRFGPVGVTSRWTMGPRGLVAV
jgi:DNA repair protein RadA/Sms